MNTLHGHTQIEKEWWWTQEDVLRSVAASVTWGKVKDAARNYELMRRSPHALEQFRNTLYPQLSGEIQMLVHRLWLVREDPYRYVSSNREYLEIGWTPVQDHHHLQWNLKLSDGALVKEFKKYIQNWRGAQSIPVVHPRKNKSSRAASWKYIEILDRKKFADGKPLNDSERHMATAARRKANQYAKEFAQAYEEWKNRPDPFAGLRQALAAEDSLTSEQLLAQLVSPNAGK